MSTIFRCYIVVQYILLLVGLYYTDIELETATQVVIYYGVMASSAVCNWGVCNVYNTCVLRRKELRGFYAPICDTATNLIVAGKWLMVAVMGTVVINLLTYGTPHVSTMLVGSVVYANMVLWVCTIRLQLLLSQYSRAETTRAKNTEHLLSTSRSK